MSTQNKIIENLKPFLQEAWRKAGYKQLVPIQLEVIPKIIEGRDIIAESPTGTGKTLAYLLPLLNNLEVDQHNIQVLILSPTRELVMQIQDEIKKWTENSGIKSAALIGGADVKRQIDKLKQHPHIVVGTPGRILELANTKKMKLHEVKTIVIDEADQLFQMGFDETVKEIVKKTLKDRQLLFFSATIPHQIEKTGQELMNNKAVVVRIKEATSPSNVVEHCYIICEQRDKLEVLRRIANLKEFKKAIVFVHESKKFDELASKLRYKGLKLELLYGDSPKVERERVINHFREERFPILLTTDVAARGLDFQGVTHVIHFDLPEESDKYLHRSGRTGRMGASGNVISLVTDREVGRINAISKKIKTTIQQKQLYQGQLVQPFNR